LLDLGDVGTRKIHEYPVLYLTGPSGTTKERGVYNHVIVDGYHNLPQFDVNGSMIVTPRFTVFGYQDAEGNVFTDGDFQVYRSHCCVVLLGASNDSVISHGMQFTTTAERALSWTGS